MKWLTYRRPFVLEGEPWLAKVVCDGGWMRTELYRGGVLVGSDASRYMLPDGQRNHQVAVQLSDGRSLHLTAGYLNHWNVGIQVDCDGRRVHESHPGKRIAWPGAPADAASLERARQESAVQRERWDRSKYSIAVDVGLALLFFVVAKLTNLTTAALVGAAAGLLVVVVQRFVRVDLLGGLAIFGVIMLLVSAGFSLLFQDDWAVKMKSTLLGLLVAGLMLSDAVFNRGRYFGRRLGFYLMQPTHPQRLAFGLGLVGLVMAGLNWAVARWASTDVWLTYSTFLDMPVSVGLFFLVLRYAQVAQPLPLRG